MIKDLEECVTSKDTSLRKVDIYWHVPLLGDNVSLLNVVQHTIICYRSCNFSNL